MNLIQRIHGHGHSQKKGERETHSSAAPFWVRHYDLVVNLVTLGRTAAVHRGTPSLVELRPGDAVLDVGCGTGATLGFIQQRLPVRAVGVDLSGDGAREHAHGECDSPE